MSLRIYFPSNSYLADLTKNYNNISNRLDLTKIDEKLNLIYLLENREVDLALVDPLTYSSISSENDYAIVPTKCLITVGYTGIASIYFAKYLREIENIAFSSQNKFFAIISSIILKEKYSFETKLVELNEIKLDDLKKFDSIIDTKKFDGYNNSLDFTEEWFDTFEYPLPIAFWIAPEEYDYDSIKQVTELLFESQKSQDIITDFQQTLYSYFEREGLIINEFSEEVIKTLEELTQLFYQLGLVDNMKDIKILGSEDI